MLGLNSGLLGVRRVPTTGSASGIWAPNEQSLANRAGIWPSTGDIHFSNVSLLLHMDGSNGSTTFTDSSSNAFSITAAGDAQITTSNAKYGSGAATLDGTGDYLQTPSDSAFAFGTGDFTVECWAYIDGYHGNNGLFTFGGTNTGLALSIIAGSWTLSTAGAGGTTMGTSTQNTYQHIAITRSGTSLRMFVDGTQLGGTITDSTNLTDNTLKIGYYYSSSYAVNADIDEFRVTTGVARYTANFTAPAAAFPNG
jgi:hypothetical protein